MTKRHRLNVSPTITLWLSVIFCLASCGGSTKTGTTTSETTQESSSLTQEQSEALLGPAVPRRKPATTGRPSASPSETIAEPGQETAADIATVLEDHSRWLISTGLGSILGTVARTVEGAQLLRPDIRASLESECLDYEFQISTISEFHEAIDQVLKRIESVDCLSGMRATTHRLILATGSDPRAEHLRGQNLSFASLEDMDFEGEDLRGTKFDGADLSGAFLLNSNLEGSTLFAANLSGATVFGDTNLRRADLRLVDLTDATVGPDVDLSEAKLHFALFNRTRFDARTLTGIGILGARGLTDVEFNLPDGAVGLRTIARESGLRKEERELGAAIRKYQQLFAPRHAVLFERYVIGGALTDFGTRPWNSLVMVFLLIPVFAFLYAYAIVRPGASGIWVVHAVDVLDKQQRAVRLTSRLCSRRLARGSKLLRTFSQRRSVRMLVTTVRIVRIALYVSFVTAFQIGWKDLSLGPWISRIQARPYTLRTIGWVRTTGGIQSLLSVYFIALWALTYFSNPFE